MTMIRRAWLDTIEHVKTLIGAAFTGCVSLAALYYWKGSGEAINELPSVAVGLIGAAAGCCIIFIWNLSAAPYRIQKERAVAAEKTIAEMQSSTPFPNAVLHSLSEKQSESESLRQTLLLLSSIFEQYRRLLNAAFLYAEFKGTPLKDSDIGTVASFIAEEAEKILPKLPFTPNKPLIFQTGWNQFRYIFSVPMRSPPDIHFPELPDGVAAQVTRVSKIDFEVTFWKAPRNEEVIGPQGFTASSEL